MNQNKYTMRYHLAIIALLVITNVLIFSVVISLEKKNNDLERRLDEAYQSNQYSEDIWYSLR